MSDFLRKICARRAVTVMEEAARVPQPLLEEISSKRGKAQDVLSILLNWPKERRAVIAEIKRKSPSKGELAPNLDPAGLAAAYQRGGAFAISCLVEPDHFGGSIGDFDAARSGAAIPLLYKDFVVSHYQIWQARAHGADLVLLIAAHLGANLPGFLEKTREAGLTALVEVHDEEELLLAKDSGAKLIGVNNRNLRTFVTDLKVSETLIPLLGDGILAIAESGISSPLEMDWLQGFGARGFLIGKSLVKAPDPEAELKRFVERSAG